MKKTFIFLVLSALLLNACSSVVERVEERESESLSYECSSDTSLDKSDLDKSWKATLSEKYPELEIYGVGSICTFEDGNTLVTFSVFNDQEANQRAVQFDSKKAVSNEARFQCNTAGDLGVSEVIGSMGESFDLTCTSGDAGWMKIENFTLDLDSFTVTAGEVVNQEWTEQKL